MTYSRSLLTVLKYWPPEKGWNCIISVELVKKCGLGFALCDQRLDYEQLIRFLEPVLLDIKKREFTQQNIKNTEDYFSPKS